MTCWRRWWIVAFVIASSLSAGQSQAVEYDDPDFPPGLLAKYSAAGTTVERIDSDLSFDWGSFSPDPRLPAGPFSAEWSGEILFRQQADYRFHVFVQGEVNLVVDGRTVLSGKADSPGWISGPPTTIGFGNRPIEVRYAKSGETARLHLFWSTDQFLLEPIHSHLLFRPESHETLAKQRHGALLFDAYRCNRCHQTDNEPPALAGPELTHLAESLSPERITARLQHAAVAGSQVDNRMPDFGLSPQQADHIATYLWSASKPMKQPKLPKAKDRQKSLEEGVTLLHSTGCLACHTVKKQGKSGPFGGGDLSDVGRKRSEQWLFGWLSTPEQINRDHRMPVFKLTTQERQSLAAALASLGNEKAERAPVQPTPSTAIPAGDARQGKQLIEQFRCASCHRIPGIDSPQPVNRNALTTAIDEWNNTCLGPEPAAAKFRPVYRNVDADAIRAYIQSRPKELSAESPFLSGQRQLDRRGCLACHERDGNRGVMEIAKQVAQDFPALAGKSEGMIPPALTAIGDKLLDKALVEAVSGEQSKRRLSWLNVRMPRFQHSDADKAALLAYLIGHDRIPDDAPQSIVASTTDANTEDRSEILVAGHTLVGPRGFSCIACHEAGSYVPRNVALGTHGSDLLMLGERMRKSFFVRWTRAPLRIVPGMEMPSYTKPVPGLLDGQVNRQLDAIWRAVNDPRFTPPTNPSVVEQFFVVEPGEPTRIVRDVFKQHSPAANKGEKFRDEYIPRAFAVGLPNGHNILLDLDTGAVREWTFGDFARQETMGKSWYWSLEGVPVASGFEAGSDLVLIPNGGSTKETSSENHPTSHRLLRYTNIENGIEFECELTFDKPVAATVHLRQQVAATAGDDGMQTGWVRSIWATGLPQDMSLWLKVAPFLEPVGNPQAVSRQSSVNQEAFNLGANGGMVRAIKSPTAGDKTSRPDLSVAFTAELKRTNLDLKPLERLIATPDLIDCLPGFTGFRLPVDASIMPTAFNWDSNGRLVFTSLKGHVYRAEDSNADGIEDRLTVIEEGLAAPFGVIPDGDDLIVAHKPEVLRLVDAGTGQQPTRREVVASGWGYTDNYHDWTCGIVRDADGMLYIGLGSDYGDPKRPTSGQKWRGSILRIEPRGSVESPGRVKPVAFDLRYPTGLAIDDAGRIFISDQQGVQNTFNEINLLERGKHYGVPSLENRQANEPGEWPAVQIPHPWTRSVNGLAFLPNNERFGPFAGHGIGCEYNERLLIRFTTQTVDGVTQGACYYFSRPDAADEKRFLGPMCAAISPAGELLVGSIHDSGWLGGRNTGEIVRLTPTGMWPNGIRELRATPDGFELEFVHPINPDKAAQPAAYTISGYTREWGGSYATPDSGRYSPSIKQAEISDDRRRVRLVLDDLRPNYVYEVTCDAVGTGDQSELFPATGHYTMKRVPKK